MSDESTGAADTADDGEEIDEFIEEEEVPFAARLQKSMDEVMDANGSYGMAMKMQMGSGTIEGNDVIIDASMQGSVIVKFKESDVRIWFDMEEFLSAAYELARKHGYVESQLERFDDDE